MDVYIDFMIEALHQLHKEQLCMEHGKYSIVDTLDKQAKVVREAHAAGNKAVIFHPQ